MLFSCLKRFLCTYSVSIELPHAVVSARATVRCDFISRRDTSGRQRNVREQRTLPRKTLYSTTLKRNYANNRKWEVQRSRLNDSDCWRHLEGRSHPSVHRCSMSSSRRARVFVTIVCHRRLLSHSPCLRHTPLLLSFQEWGDRWVKRKKQLLG